ncbi:MAG: hypothetical protein IPM79_10525 [Polyangiaceae bacterium]|jgi:hypothetical protein|nr:hypothetical protein [Polyangiaceae bacterium]MBK8938057.1 hypothetical protein [Polyangiaceae bacterium]
MRERSLGLKSMALVLASVCSCGDDASNPTEPSTLTGPVTAQDVSILFPLPAPPLRTSLIGAEESGTLGPLLPKEIYLELPYVDALLSNEATYPFLRVVSIRFDPCFPGLGEPCHAQIRLVMQPVTVSDDGEFLETLDAAIHTFYELPIDQWEGCLADVVGAREASSVEGEPVVGVHPALLTEGVEGAFMTSLREVLLRCAGQQNLTRVTFMGLENLGSRWRFGGYDISAGELVPMVVVGFDEEVVEQTFFNDDATGMTFLEATVSPASPSPDEFALFLSSTRLETSTEEERLDAFRALLRVENPTLNSPATVDCVTCHLAMPVRDFVERTYGLSGDGLEESFVSDVIGRTAAGTTHLRAFGYFEDKPSISQRTVNETSATVHYVNDNLVGK